MAIPTRPAGQRAWATNVVNNSPTGTPNREAYDSRYATTGWVYAEHPPYQVFNEWMYNMWQDNDWANTAIQQHEADIASLGGGNYVDSVVVSAGSASIPYSTHGVTNPIIQLQDSGNTIVFADIIVDPSTSDVTIQNTINGTYRIVMK